MTTLGGESGGQFLDGKVCSLKDANAALEHGDTQSACDVVYYTREDSEGDLIYIDITRIVTP